jgi:hypothetical protein
MPSVSRNTSQVLFRGRRSSHWCLRSSHHRYTIAYKFSAYCPPFFSQYWHDGHCVAVHFTSSEPWPRSTLNQQTLPSLTIVIHVNAFTSAYIYFPLHYPYCPRHHPLVGGQNLSSFSRLHETHPVSCFLPNPSYTINYLLAKDLDTLSFIIPTESSHIHYGLIYVGLTRSFHDTCPPPKLPQPFFTRRSLALTVQAACQWRRTYSSWMQIIC